MDQLVALLTDKRFMPHGHCYFWNPNLLWANVLSDILITLSYITIPLTLVYFIRKRKDIPFDWMFVAFSVFILACGATHVMEIVTIWQPYYWLAALIKTITATASVVTAFFLTRLVPLALKIPSPSQLAKVNAELISTQAQLVGSARKAGMAEIATNVLHNVGNVLNSVNVSAQVLLDQVNTSKRGGVSRVAQLMAEHQQDLGQFMSSDPKGQMLPGYLEKLGETLEAERQAMIDELAQLTARIGHIKEIVATQQTYAGTSSVTETVEPKQLLEDVVRMCDLSLTRHNIELVQVLEDTHPVDLDKHKFMQIMVNLINNAKQALDPVQTRSHQIRLRLASDEQQLIVQVIDNGEGISAANLTRVFEHGFTTRTHGHGFGLHSCSLAAQQMGGSLTAYSAGSDQGATFTLALPLKPRQN